MVNERIKELERKCWDHQTNHLDSTKFAELIIKECCDWIEGSPSTESGQLLLTKSFIIANLKGLNRDLS